MRVLLVSAFYAPHRGGVEAFVQEVAQRLNARGVTVDVVTCDTEGLGVEEVTETGSIFRLECWNFLHGTYPIPKYSRANRRLYKMLRAKGYNVLHTQTRFYVTTLIAAFVAKKWGARYVHTEHGSSFPKVGNIFVRCVAWLFDNTAGRFILRRAQAVMAVSTASATFAKRLGARDVDVVPVGVHQAFWENGVLSIPAQRKLTNIYTVLYVGRLIEAKGVQDLLAATQGLHENLRVIIIGDGPYRDQLERMAQHRTDVSFFGSKSPQEIATAMMQADVIVNPSYTEGLPTSVLEAAVLGKAIIATDVGGTRDIITHGRSGYLIQPGDVQALRTSIATLVANPQMGKRFSQEVCVHARRVANWDAIVTSILSNYESK